MSSIPQLLERSHKVKMDRTTHEAIQLIADGVRQFVADFNKYAATEIKGNYVTSGLSAYLVLAMAAYGAKGKTAEELRKVLHLPEVDSVAFNGFKIFIDKLNNTPEIALNLASKIFVHKDINVTNEFKKITDMYFHSKCASLDFSKSADTCKAVSQWCSEKTNGKIQNLISIDDINDDVGMILLNAVYFKSNWQAEFNVNETELRPFHINKSTIVNVPTMYINRKFYYIYLEDFNAECIAIPYKNESVVMIIILPCEIDDIQKIETNFEKIDFCRTEGLTSNLTDLHVYLPKFKVETNLDLRSQLQKMGLNEIFTDNANFGGISENSGKTLNVGKIQQKCIIEVNEEGTEVVITFSMLMTKCKRRQVPSEIHINRPFFYQIVDTSRGVILFAGRIVNPIDV